MTDKTVTELVQNELSNNNVQAFNVTQAALAELRNTYGSEVPDASTQEGFERAKNVAFECRTLRTALEKARGEQKKPYLEMGKLIDSQAKEIKAELSEIEEPFKSAYEQERDRRKAIIEGRKAKISELKNIDQWAFDKSSEEIAAKMEEVQDLDISPEEFGKLVNDAAEAMGIAMDKLVSAHGAAINRETEEKRRAEEAAELEELREMKRQKEAKEAEERAAKEAAEAKEREERIRKEAAEKAAAESAQREAQLKAEAEEAEERRKREAEAAAQREEQLKREAEERAAKAAEEARAAAEREAEEHRQREAEEQRKREENRRHVSAVCRRAKESLMKATGLDEEQAKSVIRAIAAKEVKDVSIKF